MEAAREALLELLRLRRGEAEAGRRDVADDEADAPHRAGVLPGEGGDRRVGRGEELLLDEAVKSRAGLELEEARDEPRPDEPGESREEDVTGRRFGAGSGHKGESVAPRPARCLPRRLTARPLLCRDRLDDEFAAPGGGQGCPRPGNRGGDESLDFRPRQQTG